MAKDNLKDRAGKIYKLLEKNYPDSKCSLDFTNPHQQLVATILSAQCTDERVNMVTPGLFKKYRSVKDFADADIAELEEDIHSTGFFRNKAKSIKSCCRQIIEKHGGIVPDTLEELVKLPGVGRKTANVVLGDSFGVPGIVVDTHVGRVSNRLGLTKNTDAVKVEFDLMELLPKKNWTLFSHMLIDHGRAICIARKPDCTNCFLLKLCDYGRKNL